MLCVSLCVCLLSVNKPVLVLRLPNEEGSMVFVPLTCGEAYQNQPVTWKKNGKTTVTDRTTTHITCATTKYTSKYTDVKI